jgi:hypothetical protein
MTHEDYMRRAITLSGEKMRDGEGGRSRPWWYATERSSVRAGTW